VDLFPSVVRRTSPARYAIPPPFEPIDAFGYCISNPTAIINYSFAGCPYAESVFQNWDDPRTARQNSKSLGASQGAINLLADRRDA